MKFSFLFGGLHDIIFTMNERMNEWTLEWANSLSKLKPRTHKTVYAHAQIALIWQRAQFDSAKQLIAINECRHYCMIFSIQFNAIQFNSIRFDFLQFERVNAVQSKRKLMGTFVDFSASFCFLVEPNSEYKNFWWLNSTSNFNQFSTSNFFSCYCLMFLAIRTAHAHASAFQMCRNACITISKWILGLAYLKL